MNYDLMGQIVVLAVLVQAFRYLLFEQKTVSRIWRRFDTIPLLGTFLTCAFCQGFWIGLAVFWPMLGIIQGIVWGFMSAWIAATWDQWAHGRKDAEKNPVEKSGHQNMDAKAVQYVKVTEEPEQSDPVNDQLAQLECNIDDMSGEFFADLLERLFAAGAVDVWFTPVYGKKNRPLYQLSALTPFEKEEDCIHTILEHSTTAGIRRRLVHRIVMDRSFVSVNVQGESVTVKRMQYKDIVKFSPEWNDCATASRKLGITVAEVYAEAQLAARKSLL